MARRPVPRFRPDLEPLGDRVVPAQVGLMVTSLADSGAGSLRAAVLTADTGKSSDKFTISIAVTGTIDLQTPLPDLNNSITVLGLGASNLTVERAVGASFPSAIFTIAQGQSVALSGLTVANADNGGIFSNGTLTVANCAIVNNSVTRPIFNGFAEGGGIMNYSGTLTVTNSVLSGNTAALGGGAGNFGSMSITGSTVSGNTATGFTANSGNHIAGSGGGIDSAGALTIDGCAFGGNSTDGHGGGVAANFQTTITASTFAGNSAFEGGGIASGGTLAIARCQLSDNTASFGGGCSVLGQTTVSSCTFAGNSATGFTGFGRHVPGEGGAMWNNGHAAVRDSLFTGNLAEHGGALFNAFNLVVQGCALTANTATELGGGLYNLGAATVQETTVSGNSSDAGGGIFNEAFGSLAIKDSAVAGNSAPAGADLFNQGTVTLDDSTVGVAGP